MAKCEILMSAETQQKIRRYQAFLQQNETKLEQVAGAHFRKQLEINGHSVKDMDLETFARLLVQSKIPKVFAESGVNHDTSDWTLQEEDILGDISVDVEVDFYNDGGHGASYKNHQQPIAAHLAYVPGALLRSDKSGTSADLAEVIVDGKLDKERLNALYERRLLPQLVQISANAQQAGKKAAITVPGIGTGMFAGKYGGEIKQAFREALENVLEKHQALLPAIDIVHYDPYNGDAAKARKIGHMDYRVCPSSAMKTTGQLVYPEGSSADTHTLTSFVAWDHFSGSMHNRVVV